MFWNIQTNQFLELKKKNRKGKCFSLYSKMPVYLLICCSPDLVCQYLYITSSHWDIFHCLVLLWFQRMSIPLSKGVKLPLPPQFLPITTTTLEILVKSSFMLSFKILAFKTSLTLNISNGVATESKIWNWAITNQYIHPHLKLYLAAKVTKNVLTQFW